MFALTFFFSYKSNTDANDDCNELGREAAKYIVYKAHVCRNKRIRDLGLFQLAFRFVATNTCRGYLDTAAHECGGDLTIDQQVSLGYRCRRIVYEATQ